MAKLLESYFIARLESLKLYSRRIFLGKTQGDRQSRRKGSSSEFADFRLYTEGDDLRFLDWNLFARLDKLFLRLFQEEEDLHLYLLIDQSASMSAGSPSKLFLAQQIAAALGCIGLSNMDRVQIFPFANGLNPSSPPLRGQANLGRMLQFLESLEAQNEGGLALAMKQFSQRPQGKGIAIVLSDFLDKSGYSDAFRYLLARQFDIFAIQILAEEEISPPWSGDLKLTDIEDGDEAEITMTAPLLKKYHETLHSFRSNLNQYCTSRGIGILLTHNQMPFEKLVFGYLRQRGLVR